jgi:hypothetical protein
MVGVGGEERLGLDDLPVELRPVRIERLQRVAREAVVEAGGEQMEARIGRARAVGVERDRLLVGCGRRQIAPEHRRPDRLHAADAQLPAERLREHAELAVVRREVLVQKLDRAGEGLAEIDQRGGAPLGRAGRGTGAQRLHLAQHLLRERGIDDHVRARGRGEPAGEQQDQAAQQHGRPPPRYGDRCRAAIAGAAAT